MSAFCQVTDGILLQLSLLEAKDARVLEAQELIRNISKRKLYPSLGHTFPVANKQIVKKLSHELW